VGVIFGLFVGPVGGEVVLFAIKDSEIGLLVGCIGGEVGLLASSEGIGLFVG